MYDTGMWDRYNTNFMLAFAGTELEPQKTLADYGMPSEATVFVYPLSQEKAVGSGEEYVAITEGKCEDYDLMPVTGRTECTDAIEMAGMHFKESKHSYSYTRGCLFSTKTNF